MTHRLHPLTATASLLMFALTVPFVLAGWSMWEIGGATLDAETYERVKLTMDSGFGDLVGRPIGREDAQFWLRVAGAAVLALCAFTSTLAFGVAARREWARHAGLLMFLLFALITVPLGLGGWFADPRPIGAPGAVAAAIGTALVVGLLAARLVADDVARATFYRQRRRSGNPVTFDDPGDDGPDGPPEPPLLAA